MPVDCTKALSYTWWPTDNKNEDYTYLVSFTVTPQQGPQRVFRPLNLLSLGETLSNSKTDRVRVNFYTTDQLLYSVPLGDWTKSTVWNPPTDSYYFMDRNALAVFNFTVPCPKYLWVQLELFFVISRQIKYSEWKLTNCSYAHSNTTTFTFKHSDNTPYAGSYELAFDINDATPDGQIGSAVVINPGSLETGKLPTDQAPKFTNTVGIRTIVNKAGVNDRVSASDDITVYIYSDVLNQMFKCGEFSVKTTGIIDFQDL